MSRFLIVGLGNPGRRYERTRHNVGFMAVDTLVHQLGGSNWRAEHQSLTSRCSLGDETLIIAKPQTFMNNSGTAVRSLSRFSDVIPARILVVSDDLDLPFGRLRLRAGGSAGGHNGLKSLIAELGTQDFPRIRIGIGRPVRGETIDWVLSDFSVDERAELTVVCEAACVSIKAFIRSGIVQAMNTVNGIADVRSEALRDTTEPRVVRPVEPQGI